nr:hypothetical protein CFP56_32473 [Quercus suber]
MEPINISPQQIALSRSSRQNADPLAIFKPTTATKEEIRGWRQSRPLSAGQHTDLSMKMWNRASLPTPSNREHIAAPPKTRPSDLGNVSKPIAETETVGLMPSPHRPADATAPRSVREPKTFGPAGQKHIVSPADNTANIPDGPQASNRDTSASPGERGDDTSGCTEPVMNALAEQLESKRGQDFWGPVGDEGPTLYGAQADVSSQRAIAEALKRLARHNGDQKPWVFEAFIVAGYCPDAVRNNILYHDEISEKLLKRVRLRCQVEELSLA